MRWPILTLAGITAAVIVGIAHAAALKIRADLRSCLLGYDDLLPKGYADAFGPDGYGPR